jgi:putative DNA methylase
MRSRKPYDEESRSVTGRRLIEVDLPIKAISAHARREKSIRHGHISTLHIWWARRPLAACRAVILATLLPDPADPACPPEFRARAAEALRFRFGGRRLEEPEELRRALLDFVAELAAWERSTDPDYLACARALVAAAHPEGPPLVVDPFAGGGAIPLEALRVGAEAWACDYNPVAALLLKVVLEDIPRYGERLADGVREWGGRVKERVEADVGRFYPPDPDGAVPIAYLWARTVTCEGPGCGAEIPLLRQLWLARKGRRQVALRLRVDRERKAVDFEVVESPDTVGEGTTRNGAAVCPVCSFVTPNSRVQAQAQARGGLPVRMVAVVRTWPGRQGRHYRVATEHDTKGAQAAGVELRRLEEERSGGPPLVPVGALSAVRPSSAARGVSAVTRYGLRTWGDLFLPRQALALSAFCAAVRDTHEEVARETGDAAFARAVATSLAIAVDRQADRLSTLARWDVTRDNVTNTFARQALPMVWDFAEANPFSGATGDWEGAVEWVEKVARHGGASAVRPGHAAHGDARALPLPDASVAYVVTDPPYYDQIPYSDLSDFFAEWLHRTVGHLYPELLARPAVEKAGDLIVNAGHRVDGRAKDKAFFRDEMSRALAEARRVLAPAGTAVFVFAHKETDGWEALLGALVKAGWKVTGSWPIETEMATRVRARNAASLQSSVHIVCRPRPERAGVGSWREVRPEVERRVGEWLPRLASEGIEGADAIFACLGPALEAYSRYERVETAAGEPVPLSPPVDDPEAPALLPAVWAAVARTALAMLFEGAEAEGFEEDARLTALWLWTLKAGGNGGASAAEEELAEDEEAPGSRKAPKGLALDYDTARKLAQALGAHLEALDHPGGIVEVKGSVARLRSLAERRRGLLGDGHRPRREDTLFESAASASDAAFAPGQTTLDRLHQAMLLFGDGRGDALRRLLAEPGYASDERFLRLARSLSALYPAQSQEKRWLDGVLAAARQARV